MIIEILVAGYNNDGSHQVYSIRIPGEINLLRNSNQKNNEYGSSWLGQVDVVSRIVLGYDGRIGPGADRSNAGTICAAGFIIIRPG